MREGPRPGRGDRSGFSSPDPQKSAFCEVFLQAGITGISGALGVTRFLSSLLCGVKPSDPLTFLVVSLVLAGVALLAGDIPGRPAAKEDAIVARLCAGQDCGEE